MPDSAISERFRRGVVEADEVDGPVNKESPMGLKSGVALDRVMGVPLDKAARRAARGVASPVRGRRDLSLDPGLAVAERCPMFDDLFLREMKGGPQRKLDDLVCRLSLGQNEVGRLLEQDQREYDLTQSQVFLTYESWQNSPLISEKVRAGLSPPPQDWSRVSKEELKQLEETLSSMKKVTEIEGRRHFLEQNAKMQLLLMCVKAFVDILKRVNESKSRITQRLGARG